MAVHPAQIKKQNSVVGLPKPEDPHKDDKKPGSVCLFPFIESLIEKKPPSNRPQTVQPKKVTGRLCMSGNSSGRAG